MTVLVPLATTDRGTEVDEFTRVLPVSLVNSSFSDFRDHNPDPLSDSRRIRALVTGHGVEKRHFDGSIHSVFDRVCNVMLDDGGLVSIVAPEFANAPRAVKIEISRFASFSSFTEVGQSANCRAGIIRLSGVDKTIDLRNASTWTPIPLNRRTHIDPPTHDSGRRHLQSFVESAHQAEDLKFWQESIGCFISNNFDQLSTTRCAADLRELIGRGPGLTPAGDDFITGFLAAIHLFSGRSEIFHTFLANFKIQIEIWSRKTTDLSAWMLRDATMGWFAEPVLDLCHALGNEEMSDLSRDKLAARVLALGHLSGLATLSGLLSGLDYCRNLRFGTHNSIGFTDQ